jgi:hypothetical protein
LEEHITSIFRFKEQAKQETSMKAGGKAELATCFHAGFFLGLFFDPENRGDMFLQNFS